MAFLSDGEKQQIAKAIRTAESRTSGEIVTVIAGASDAYNFIPMLWASSIALLTPLPFLLLDQFGRPMALSMTDIYTLQLGLFVAMALLFRWQPLKMKLIPKAVQRRRAGRLAREQFLAQGLHHTEGRTGVLLFVSVAERYVEVLADSGINDKVEQGAWDTLVADFVAKVKGGQVAEGFLGAVAACGDLLSEHFPKPEGNPNELPNHLVEI